MRTVLLVSALVAVILGVVLWSRRADASQGDYLTPPPPPPLGLLIAALWVYRKLNPATDPIQAQYTNETDKSTITVGPATIRPALSGNVVRNPIIAAFEKQQNTGPGHF